MKKCLFIGSKEFGLISLKTIYEIEPKSLIGCLTIDDKHDCRSKFYEIKNYCDIKQIPIEVVYKHCQLSEYIKKYKPDFCIVLGWYQIIEKNILDMCPDGFIGVHASLLPRYRGFAPLVWAILNGEKETGISLFYINEHMDEGDIISQKLLEIKSEDYISDVLNNEYKLTNEIIGENYGLLLTGKVNRIKQDNNNASYCSKRIPSDGKIEWCNLAKDIYNFIRAQSNPYPGAFIYDENMNKVYIERAEVFTYEYYGIFGRILKVEKDKLLVCCKGGAIYIKPILSNEDLRKKFKFGQSLT